MPDKNTKDEVIEYHAPRPLSLPRPSADIPLKTMQPTISSALSQLMATPPVSNVNGNNANGSIDIPIGTMCKNNGCKQVFY